MVAQTSSFEALARIRCLMANFQWSSKGCLRRVRVIRCASMTHHSPLIWLRKAVVVYMVDGFIEEPSAPITRPEPVFIVVGKCRIRLHKGNDRRLRHFDRYMGSTLPVVSILAEAI